MTRWSNALRLLWRTYQDPSGWSLLAANLVTIVFALVQDWSLPVLMWVYVGQSIIIGCSNLARIVGLPLCYTEGGAQRNVTAGGKIGLGLFFVFHYGGFQAGYLLFLATELGLPRADAWEVGLCVGIFLVNHAYSCLHNWPADRSRRRDIWSVFLFPYARILPMHLTIVFGLFLAHSAGALLFFLVLKTLADLAMHAAEHVQQSAPAVRSRARQ